MTLDEPTRTAIRLLNICWNADPLSSTGESRTKVLPYQNNNPYELKLMNWDMPNVIPFNKPLLIPSSIGRCKACEYKDNNLVFIPNAVTVLIPDIACTATAPLFATRSCDASVFARRAFICAKLPMTINGKMPNSTNDILSEPNAKAMVKAAAMVTRFCTERPRFWPVTFLTSVTSVARRAVIAPVRQRK